ncbi:hypothetical protein [Anaeromicrobium sediminis]|uniref:Uncharacterized protein n=1 Tax=Anaeromicrobium sediminis TaxID=1478221 RepID=A0A267MN42_9FIRM|nr:hypothetical protein [Anaeromicrobium sediminis]PAB61021.1 hypothetical protein CCE28_00905 [Anaeromicrobium sediminis]
MDIKGELVAVYKDETRRKLRFRGYVEHEEDGMSDVEVQTLYDEAGNYVDMDEINGFEILGYESKEKLT